MLYKYVLITNKIRYCIFLVSKWGRGDWVYINKSTEVMEIIPLILSLK